MNLKKHPRRILKMRSMLVMLLACLVLVTGKGFADFGKSGWTIFRKAEAANSRGIISSLGTYGSLSGLFYNPALLGAKTEREAFLFSEAGFAQDRLGGILYGEPLRNGMFAVGMAGYDAGTMELNWVENGALMSESVSAQRDLLGLVSYGRRLRNDIYVGATVKAATSALAQRNSANAFAADFGAAYLSPKGLTISAAIQNVGTSTKFVEHANPLPTSAYVGAGYAAKIKDYHLLTGVGATYNMVDDMITPEVGAELKYKFLSMNLGYRFNAKEAVMTMGIGVSVNNVEFGYAYIPGIYLGSTQRVTMSYKFNSLFGKSKKEAKGAISAAHVSSVSTVKPVISPSATAPKLSAPAKSAPTSTKTTNLSAPKSTKTAVKSTTAKKTGSKTAVTGKTAKKTKKKKSTTTESTKDAPATKPLTTSQYSDQLKKSAS